MKISDLTKNFIFMSDFHFSLVLLKNRGQKINTFFGKIGICLVFY